MRMTSLETRLPAWLARTLGMRAKPGTGGAEDEVGISAKQLLEMPVAPPVPPISATAAVPGTGAAACGGRGGGGGGINIVGGGGGGGTELLWLGPDS